MGKAFEEKVVGQLSAERADTSQEILGLLDLKTLVFFFH